MKGIATLVALATAGLLLLAVDDLPRFGDPHSPANSHPKASGYYVEHTMSDSNVPNIVTSVLADYRGFDTMFETAVVFVAAMGIFSILKRNRKKSGKKAAHEESIIISTATKYMVPFMQLFALYVIAHGHHSPGGGFQGGVILGASMILTAMAFGIKEVTKQISESALVISAAVGVLIYSGIGVICMILGGNFLDYSVLHKILPATDEVMARSHAMLGVEIGVALTVMCGMFLIYASLSSDGEMEGGL